MDQNSQNIALINNSRTPDLLRFNIIFEFLGQCTKDAYIIFQKGVDNFEIEHKTCYFFSFGV